MIYAQLMTKMGLQMNARVLSRSTLLLLAAGSSTSVAAEIEEIIVTAQHREQNLQDVPAAVSALSGEQVVKQGIHDLTGIATRVPGLTFSPFSPGQNIVALRGDQSRRTPGSAKGQLIMAADFDAPLEDFSAYS